MSAIDNTAYPNAFSTTMPSQAETATPQYGAAAAPYAGASKDVIVPIFGPGSTAPLAAAQADVQPAQSPWASPGDASGGFPSFASVMSGFINALQGLMTNLYRQLGVGGSGAQLPGMGAQPGGRETFVQNARAGSVGDPHDSFDATTAAGQTLADKWDNMQAHGDLLDSDSFGGGYRVSTTVTQPNSNGVTMNKSATVALDNGAADVTMNADGSFSVTSSSGANVQMQPGATVQLGGGASVTLGTDGALTVNDTNAAGGTLATQLASNGHGGVDVHATATDVDLGGYLVNRANAPAPTPPVRVTPLPTTPAFDQSTFEAWSVPPVAADPIAAPSADPPNIAAGWADPALAPVELD